MQNELEFKMYTLKSLSDKHWACRIKAIKIIVKQLDELVMAMQKIVDEDHFMEHKHSLY